MRRHTRDAFVKRLKQKLGDRDHAGVAFFLGAGCSVSSGIPAAKDLTRHWAERLHRLEGGTTGDWEAWASNEFEGFADSAATCYAAVYERLFAADDEGQREIERICANAMPGYGYARLAALLTHDTLGSRCNVVLTTNFDDLVADSLYLFTQKKPRVIVHESLSGMARASAVRPLIVKLHGDALFRPYSRQTDCAKLQQSVADAAHRLLLGRDLVIVGYGGNDESILGMLQAMPNQALDGHIWWVTAQVPDNDLARWIEKRRGHWVEHLDFDELMLLIGEELDLPLPKLDRFEEVFDSIRLTHDRLRDQVLGSPSQDPALTKAVGRSSTRMEVWDLLARAERVQKTDPDQAQRLYEESSEVAPCHPAALGNYANFLSNVRGDHDRAEEFLRRAIDADPNHATNLGNYANFLTDVRGDHDQAEAFYRRALDADPNDADYLGNYAIFLTDVRGDHDQAEQFYRRALDADPNNARILGSYALFLKDVRGDHDQAEAFYQRAIDADPNNAIILGNYAVLLKNVRGDHDRAEEFLRRAIDADPNHANNLGNYAVFLTDVRGEHDQAEAFYLRAIDADPNAARILGNYAIFLKNVRGDHDQAEAFYQRAIEADPNAARILGNYANFLWQIRSEHDQAEAFYQRALDADPNDASSLGNYAQMLFATRRDEEARELLRRALALEPPKGPLLAELHFYRYAHLADARDDGLRQLKALLVEGVRSKGWDLSANVTRAVEDGHPEPELLRKLAAVIGDGEAIEALEAFAAWRAA